MAQYLEEPLDGGMVTTKPAAKLAAGEVVLAENCAYYPYTTSIARSPGLTIWTSDMLAAPLTDASSGTGGLAQARFKDGSNYILSQSIPTTVGAGSLLVASADSDGSAFSRVVTGLVGIPADTTQPPGLSTVQYDNRHYIFNGVDPNTVMVRGGTTLGTRAHGLLPVTSNLIYVSATTSTFSATASGYYEYWHTETQRFNALDGQELESTYIHAGGPLKVLVTSTTAAPAIRVPAPVNLVDGVVTNFRIYRSEAMTTVNETRYPVGTKILDLSGAGLAGAVLDLSFVDTSTSAPLAAAVPASEDATAWHDMRLSLPTGKSFIGGASSIVDAVSTPSDGKSVRFTKANPVEVFTVYGFPFSSSIAGTITGIEVAVRAKASTNNVVTLMTTIGIRGPDSFGNSFNYLQHRTAPGVDITTGFMTGGIAGAHSIGARFQASVPIEKALSPSTSFTTITLGSATDPWLPSSVPWAASDFSSSFAVQFKTLWGAAATAGSWIEIDSVTVVVHYLGTNVNVADSSLYSHVSVDGLTYPANNKPPTASIGTLSEGCLLTNSVAEPRRIYWSMPGSPDYFPTGVYWMELPTHSGDAITCMETINNRVVIGARGTLWRLNYVPLDADASFSTGRALEIISTRRGVVHPRAYTKWTSVEGREELAFVDSTGLFSTDGYTIRPLMDDLRWIGPTGDSGIITTPVSTQVVALLNDPTTSTLRLVLSTGVTYIGSYAPRHQKNGQPKWTYAITTQTETHAVSSVQTVFTSYPTAAAVIQKTNGTWFVVYGFGRNDATSWDGGSGVGGGIWREDSNDSTAYAGTPSGASARSMRITTRDIFPAGLNGAAELTGVLVQGTALGTGSGRDSISASITVTEVHEGQADTTLAAVTSDSVSTCSMSEIGTSGAARGFRYSIVPQSTGMNILTALTQQLTDFSPGDHLA